MPLVTVVFGIILIAMGAGGYFGTGSESVTALIPAFFGVPMVIAGLLARQEKFLKHAMHAAALLALLGAAGAGRGLAKLQRC